jgi:hypothetical protein
MDDNVVGMQMNLFLWAESVKTEPKQEAKVIDAVSTFLQQRGRAKCRRFLAAKMGIPLPFEGDAVMFSLDERRRQISASS